MRRPIVLAALTLAVVAAPSRAATPAAFQQQDSAARDTSKKKKDLPLEPGRSLQFNATQGSWISVDVSPDGQTIAFDLLGDIYTMPISGGTATRLTSGLAFDAQPRFSPDGKRIVFVSDRSGGDNIWVMSLDKKDTVQVTKGNNNLYVSPEWTPDGSYIVASKTGGLGGAAKLWMYHVDGGTGAQLITAEQPQQIQQLKTVGAAFGPDGRYIWYAQRQGDWQYNAIFPQYQLAIYDRETGARTTMSARYGSAFRPALSPDGKWLVYGSRHETNTGLRIRDMSSGEEDWLAYPIQRDDQESRSTLDVLPGYSFTPDSRAVIMSYGGEIWRVPVDKSAPSKIPMSAQVALDIGPRVHFDNRIDDSATFVARQIRDAVPSPDGKRLAFTAFDRLYVMDFPGGAPRRVTNLEVGEFQPAWSPDGRSLAFVTWDDSGGGHIYRVASDGRGRGPQRLTRVTGLYSQLAWAPSGSRIVAVRSAARDLKESIGFFQGGLGTQFVWVPAAGGDVTVISPTGNRYAPHFAADTSRIYAYGPQDGLVSMRWDGTDIKRHVKVTGPMLPQNNVEDDILHGGMNMMPRDGSLEQNPTPPPAALVKMAPRGDRALAQVGNDLYVVTVPMTGGPTPTVSVADPSTAAFPARRLTDIGGQFAVWSADGRYVHWSIGNAHVVYDLERAKQVDDSLKLAKRAVPSADSAARAQRDSTQRDSTARTDSAATKAPMTPGYKPAEHRIVVRGTRDIPQGSVLLRGARVITMKGNEILENADILVRNNRIAAVGARGSVQVPAGTQEVDVSGKTIVPGFVDTHYHSQWLIPNIHPAQVWQYLTNLAYGVTTTRDPQTATTDVLTYADRVESGAMIGPRIYSTGPGVFAAEQIKDLDHARNVLKRYAQYYDTKTLKMYMSGNRQQRQWIIMAARELGLMPTTEGGLDFKLNLTHAMDGYSGLEHSLPITPVYGDVLELFKYTGIAYTPTLLVSYGGPFGENYYYATENVYGDPKLARFTPNTELQAKARRRGNNPGPGGWFMKEEYVFPKHAEFAKRLVEAGGRVGIGSHGQIHGVGYHWEMWSMQSGGMSNHDVLRAATIIGAQAIGFEKDIGTIETGKMADLVVLDANPLENIRNTNSVRFVMKNGRIYEGDTLNEVWPSKRPLPQQAWQGGAPATQAGIH
jgi:Tol biopolymer transport system component